MKTKDFDISFNHPTRTAFILLAISEGFFVSNNKNGWLVAKKKNCDGINIRLMVSPYNVHFSDGKEEPMVQVFENNQSNSDLKFKLSEFDVHD